VTDPARPSQRASAARPVSPEAVSEGVGNMGTKVAQTRVVEGRELPPVGRWVIDPVHSTVPFVARHMMISKVRGRFREFEGWVDVAERPEDSRVEVAINAASIDTGDPGRDEHLRSPDFLDVEHFPLVTYRSTSVRPIGDRVEVVGDLTIRDCTRPVTLDVEFEGVAVDPWGNLRAGFVASGDINREDFDITWNQALETGGFLVGKGVRIELDVEAVLQDQS
jgi:polyisoprenoid-binding protein YceI